MITQTDPKVDYAFKHVFGREESKPALRSLLNSIVQPTAGARITSLELLNPFNEKASESAKLSIVDIKARDESGRQFLVEMQMLAADSFRERALFYWAALYQEQMRQGDDWPMLRPTIAVCFVDSPLFADLNDYHLLFELRERHNGTLFTDQLALHILELPKFNIRIEELKTPLDRWLYFLRHGDKLDAEAVPGPLDVPEIRWALGDLLMISRTDPDRELYEARLRERRDQAARRQAALEAEQAARTKGLAEGRAVGVEQGRAEGRAEALRAVIPALERSLGRDTTSSEELRALSLDELESIWSELQTALPNHRS